MGDWKANHKLAEKLSDEPRFITVRYEDLVTSPDATQAYLLDRLPFLKNTHLFSEYHLIAKPSAKSTAALGGARPITLASVGNWRKQKSFLKAQIALYGDIDKTLIKLGYEKDTQWLDELVDVVPDNEADPQRKKQGLKQLRNKFFTQPRRKLLYRLSVDRRIGPLVRSLRSSLRSLTK